MKTSIRDTQSASSIGTDGLRLRHTSRLWYRQAAEDTDNLPEFDLDLVRTTNLLVSDDLRPQLQLADALATLK